MPTLYVVEQGARVEKEYGRLLVTREDEVIAAVPIKRVSHVVLVGNVGVTTPALSALLGHGVGLSLVNRLGKLKGMLVPATGKNIRLRRMQYQRAQDGGFCLELSRRIVEGKLRNERTLAMRLRRSYPERVREEPLDMIQQALEDLPKARGLDDIRGLEGFGARAYFAMFRQALERVFQFEGRNRRPPKDPVNAMLSLGYTLLTQNMITACEVTGWGPYDCFFHSEKYGKPALALDLVEEFRHIIVDSVVMTLVNRNMVDEGDFVRNGSSGVYMRKEALKKFFAQYVKRLNTRVSHPLAGRSMTYQKVFEIQARGIRKLIEGKESSYRPFLVR